jgi:hypothetical protein
MNIFVMTMNKTRIFIKASSFILFILILCSFQGNVSVFTSETGKTAFVSEAPLELIKAESGKLSCFIDISKRTFAFSIPIETFEGFNNPLQKERFLENYMEASKFKTASFKGKIIEEIDLSKAGTYTVRSKGILNIHGVDKEKIVKTKITVKAQELELEAHFEVALDDHNIKIPKIVNQKIAEVISVEVKATLMAKK